MEEFLSQIQSALKARLYYLALFGALALPDICAALDDQSGMTSGAKYKAWFDSFGPRYGPTFDGTICYGYRCSMIHQGSAIPHSGAYDRVLFIEPGQGWQMHNCTMTMTNVGKVLVMDVEKLCNEMVEACRIWYSQYGQTGTVQQNLKTFVTRYPSGFAPYLLNMSVIA